MFGTNSPSLWVLLPTAISIPVSLLAWWLMCKRVSLKRYAYDVPISLGIVGVSQVLRWWLQTTTYGELWFLAPLFLSMMINSWRHTFAYAKDIHDLKMRVEAAEAGEKPQGAYR